MGKKKLSLKPVQRGFATTSVATKKPAVEVVEDDAQPSVQAAETTVVEQGNSQAAEASGASVAVVKEDWEDERTIEEAALQGLVDRLHDKGEKEVNRIIKAIEYDTRLAVSFPKLDINQDVRDRILELALEEEQFVDKETAGTPKSFPPAPTQVEADKVLLRLYVTYHVLIRLGFTSERVEECLRDGLSGNDGWEEGLEWMWTHLSEDECLAKGDYARIDAPSLPEPDDPLTLNIPDQDRPPDPVTPPEPTNKLTSSIPEPSSQPQISLFQSLDASTTAESDSDDEPDLNKVNEQWAGLSLELDTLKQAGGAKGKGKKGKGTGVVLETPEIRALKEKMNKLEKEYMFSRKDADVLFKALKARRDADALEARLKGVSVTEPASTAEPEAGEDANGEGPAQVADGDEDEGMFGNMLDEPVLNDAEAPSNTTNTNITVRPMPIPKQFSFGGNIPKPLLRSCLTKSARHAVITYAKLSGSSRAARAGVEIRWSAQKRRVWRMDDIACEDMVEAENYVSTLALNELVGSGDILSVNWRTMPPAYRDLWEELEVAKKDREDSGKRQVWGRLKGVMESKIKVEVVNENEKIVKAISTTEEISGTSRTPQSDYSERLQTDFERRQSSPAYQKMLPQRNSLPIANYRQDIINTLEHSQVMVLSGETGCGKSTQLPSFILEDALAKGKPVKIYVTEPRRISAISLAQRVSQELGDAPGAMGSNSSLVGYSIRLEAKVSASTRLAFVTNGIALRMLEAGSGSGGRSTGFDEITHIIVDEVHERSIESDFLLIVLKTLMQQRKDLKVILMSATVDAEKISAFFGGCPFMSVPGRTFPVNVNYLEDAVELARWHIDESSQYAIRRRNMKTGAKQLEWNDEAAENDSDSDSEGAGSDPTKLSATRYSASTVSTVNLLDSRQIPYDLIVRLLERICFEDSALSAFSGAVLVFMPGLAEIRKFNDMLQGHPGFGGGDFVVYPLHSTISSEGQSAVFDIPAQGVRKIVISTNIAETGVTIPDITCVIDSGKHREMRYDEKRQISRLVETYIARSNAKQRRGRAGRVQEGLAFHLFSKARHDTQLAEHPIPEMLRLSLQDLALRIKILKIKTGSTIEEVLSRALDPPSPLNIQRAIASLVEVKALTSTEDITPMGRLLSKLPMDVHLGKFLLVAALFKCLDPALTIAATLNSKSPFVTPFGYEGQADLAKRSFAIGNSDFFTIANVFASWRRASENPSFVRTFCKKNYVSQQNLQQIEELRQQLLSYLIDSGFVDATPAQRQEISQARYSRGFRTRFVSVPSEMNVNADNLPVLSAALAAGLYPKLLSLDVGSGGLKTITNQQPAAIHPSSINFRTPKSDYDSNYLVYFTIMQSKKLYAWDTGPVDDRALVLLCGDQADFRLSASSLQLDRKIRYNISPKTAIALKLLRERFSIAMASKMKGKSISEEQKRWFDLGIKCLTTGMWDAQGPSVGVV